MPVSARRRTASAWRHANTRWLWRDVTRVIEAAARVPHVWRARYGATSDAFTMPCLDVGFVLGRGPRTENRAASNMSLKRRHATFEHGTEDARALRVARVGMLTTCAAECARQRVAR